MFFGAPFVLRILLFALGLPDAETASPAAVDVAVTAATPFDRPAVVARWPVWFLEPFRPFDGDFVDTLFWWATFLAFGC